MEIFGINTIPVQAVVSHVFTRNGAFGLTVCAAMPFGGDWPRLLEIISTA
jgi:hypothetical protein